MTREPSQGPVRAVDFQPPDVCDGGKPIWRVAARVDVLKTRGHGIEADRLANGTAVYRLTFDVERAVGGSTTGAPPAQPVADLEPSGSLNADGSLFDADAFAQQPSYRDAEAA